MRAVVACRIAAIDELFGTRTRWNFRIRWQGPRITRKIFTASFYSFNCFGNMGSAGWTRAVAILSATYRSFSHCRVQIYFQTCPMSVCGSTDRHISS
jgi:hypothetical protein